MRLIAAAAAALLLASSAGAVSFINGSFEDGRSDVGAFTTLTAGDTTSITGWEVLPDGIDYIGSYWQASDGTRSLDLSALNSGGVMQTVGGFELGKHYRITFDLSANPESGIRPKRVVVSATSGVATIYNYLNPSNTVSDMQYVTYTYDFIATNVNQDVQFRSLENNAYGPVLDNVSISLIPEPATWGLMVVGFGLVGAFARRRARERTAVA